MYSKFRELLGKDKIPAIKGEKTSALFEDVLIPLLKDISLLKVELWLSILCVFATGSRIGPLIKEAGHLATQCEKQVTKFKDSQGKNNGSVVELGMYAKAAQPNKEVITNTNTLGKK